MWQKICLRYFELSQTYFRLSPLYFQFPAGTFLLSKKIKYFFNKQFRQKASVGLFSTDLFCPHHIHTKISRKILLLLAIQNLFFIFKQICYGGLYIRHLTQYSTLALFHVCLLYTSDAADERRIGQNIRRFDINRNRPCGKQGRGGYRKKTAPEKIFYFFRGKKGPAAN